jgi:colicin import membrane protein
MLQADNQVLLLCETKEAKLMTPRVKQFLAFTIAFKALDCEKEFARWQVQDQAERRRQATLRQVQEGREAERLAKKKTLNAKRKAEEEAREEARKELMKCRVKKEKARRGEEQARNATMSAAEIAAVVVGRGAESAEKRARVRADVEKHERKRKRLRSAEKKQREQARASPAHAKRKRRTPTKKERLAAKRARRNQPRTQQTAHGPGGRPPLRMDANSVHLHAASQTSDDHPYSQAAQTEVAQTVAQTEVAQTVAQTEVAQTSVLTATDLEQTQADLAQTLVLAVTDLAQTSLPLRGSGDEAKRGATKEVRERDVSLSHVITVGVLSRVTRHHGRRTSGFIFIVIKRRVRLSQMA